MKKLTTEQFIIKAIEIHGKVFDYSKTYYKNSQKKVTIICDSHGEFEQKPNNHLQGKGCNKCKRIKTKKTCLEKYGVENVNQVTEYKEKSKKTCLEKYGAEFSFQSNNNKTKSKKTRLEKYGDENYRNEEKYKKTCLEKYGVDNVFKSKKIKLKIKSIFKNQMTNKYTEFASKNNLTFIKWQINDIFFKCNECLTEFEIQPQLASLKQKQSLVVCPRCNPPNQSSNEKKLIEFIEKHYNKSILSNNRRILNNLELDVYIPDLKLAFEFNGLYWHNELQKPKNYHLDKTTSCKEKGIHLIHIYEDDWMYKKEIVQSRILNLLNKSYKIYARKCEIKLVSNSVVKSFLNESHIQGYCPSSVNIGLYYDGTLVSLMTFSNAARFKNKGWELIRFCNSLNTVVVGGASKLLKHFIKTHKPEKIISYADRSWSNGNVYEKLGFKYEKKTVPNYYYVIKNMRENRFKYRKSELVKQGFDENKTEKEIMFERGFYRIYDSGNLKYSLKI